MLFHGTDKKGATGINKKDLKTQKADGLAAECVWLIAQMQRSVLQKTIRPKFSEWEEALSYLSAKCFTRKRYKLSNTTRKKYALYDRNTKPEHQFEKHLLEASRQAS